MTTATRMKPYHLLQIQSSLPKLLPKSHGRLLRGRRIAWISEKSSSSSAIIERHSFQYLYFGESASRFWKSAIIGQALLATGFTGASKKQDNASKPQLTGTCSNKEPVQTLAQENQQQLGAIAPRTNQMRTLPKNKKKCDMERLLCKISNRLHDAALRQALDKTRVRGPYPKKSRNAPGVHLLFALMHKVCRSLEVNKHFAYDENPLSNPPVSEKVIAPSHKKET